MWKSAVRLLTAYPGLLRRLYWMAGRGTGEKQLFLGLIRRGDIVFDVGANRGHFTLLFSRLSGPTGVVHAFEASPHTVKLLESTLRSNAHPSNVVINNVAVGGAQEKVLLYMPGDDDGQASLAKHASASWAKTEQIRHFECDMIKLEDYVRQRQIDRVDVVKMDIEGAELGALRGFASELKRLRPIISFEICLAWMKDFGYTAAELEQVLRSAGYNAFYLVTQGLKPLQKTTSLEEASKQGFSVDVLCADTDRHHERLRILLASGS